MHGTGMFMAAAPTDPNHADKLAETILEMIKDFAERARPTRNWPLPRSRLANQLDSQMKEPLLDAADRELTYHGRPLADLKALPGVFQTFTAHRCRMR